MENQAVPITKMATKAAILKLFQTTCQIVQKPGQYGDLELLKSLHSDIYSKIATHATVAIFKLILQYLLPKS